MASRARRPVRRSDEPTAGPGPRWGRSTVTEGAGCRSRPRRRWRWRRWTRVRPKGRCHHRRWARRVRRGRLGRRLGRIAEDGSDGSRSRGTGGLDRPVPTGGPVIMRGTWGRTAARPPGTSARRAIEAQSRAAARPGAWQPSLPPQVSTLHGRSGGVRRRWQMSTGEARGRRSRTARSRRARRDLRDRPGQPQPAGLSRQHGARPSLQRASGPAVQEPAAARVYTTDPLGDVALTVEIPRYVGVFKRHMPPLAQPAHTGPQCVTPVASVSPQGRIAHRVRVLLR